jgi:hypothetical protein
MAVSTGFVAYADCKVRENQDYLVWSDEQVRLIAHFGRIPEAKTFGIGSNLFVVGFVLDGIRYGRNGKSFSQVISCPNIMEASRIAYLNSMPENIRGMPVESRVLSYPNLKIIVSEMQFREAFRFFDLKFMLGDYCKSSSGIIGQTLLPDDQQLPADKFLTTEYLRQRKPCIL